MAKFDFVKLLSLFFKARYVILINFIVISVVAVYYSFNIAKKEYVSSTTFLAPQESQSITSLLQMGGFTPLNTNDIMPQQIVTIFESKVLRRKIINRFNLLGRYKLTKSSNAFELAVKNLKKDILLDITEMGSLGISTPISFTVSCFHTSPDTSFQMANYCFELLDSTIKSLSTSSAKRNREFVESQLKINYQKFDSIQGIFGKYQIDNKIYDIPAQLQMSLNTYGQIKSQILANEIKIKTLLQNFNASAPQIIELKKENNILSNELSKIEKTSNPDIFLGFEKSVELSPVVMRYAKEVEVLSKVIALLTQQLEEAKLSEAKDMSVLRQIDSPYVPVYKIRPRRAMLIGSIVMSYMSLLVLLIFIVSILRSSLISDFIYEIRKSLKT
jgi:capsule polysaccharide export protein KpsE/RkpR